MMEEDDIDQPSEPRSRRGHALSVRGELRVLIGLALQPFVAALVAFVLFPVLEHTRADSGRSVDMRDAAISVGLGVGLVAIPITVIFPAPLLAWLMKRGPVAPGHALTAGALLGNVPSAFVIVATTVSRLRRGEMTEFYDVVAGVGPASLFGSLIGFLCAAVFWLVAGGHLAGGHDDDAQAPSSDDWK